MGGRRVNGGTVEPTVVVPCTHVIPSEARDLDRGAPLPPRPRSTLVACAPRGRRLASLGMTTALGMTILALPLAAQRPTQPPVRQLGPAIATSAITFQQVQHLRVLGDGRVLVNDPGKRQIVMLDSSLANPKVVVDSAGGVNMYGMQAGALIPFAADSTLFVDRGASAFLVIDPTGSVARVMSFPPGNPAQYLTTPNSAGYPAFSSNFGIVYRIPMPRPQIQRPREGEPEITRKFEDSALVVAMNVKRRSLDTLARLGTGSMITMRLSANNNNTNTQTPIFPVFDDWTVLSDGTIAVLRGREYRLDFYDGEAERTAAPRLFYPWKQMDDAEKTRIVDSINTQRRKQFDEMLDDMRKRATNPEQPAGPGGEKIIIVDGMPIRTYNGERMPPPTPPAPVLSTDMPDYMPAVERGVGSYRADADNRVWIRPKPPAGAPRGGVVYEIVDRSGVLVDRVQIPVGRTLVGFGPGGAVYLTWRDAGATKIERRSAR